LHLIRVGTAWAMTEDQFSELERAVKRGREVWVDAGMAAVPA
jgi:hypothetical protein